MPGEALLTRPDRRITRRRSVAAASLLLLTACGGNNSASSDKGVAESSPLPSSSSPSNHVSARNDVPEVTQFESSEVFGNYQGPGDIQGELEPGDKVTVDCLMYDPDNTATTSFGLYYRLGGPKKFKDDYVVYRQFWNQPNPTPPDQGNVYDPRVAVCSDSPEQNVPDPNSDFGQ
jgi:hypothetical protein